MAETAGPPPPPGPGDVPGVPLRVLVASPLGPLGIEIRGATLTGLDIQPAGQEIRRYKSLKDVERSEFLDEALGRLSEYFAGARRDLELEFDPLGVTGFARRVLDEATRIPYGTCQSYQEVATALGNPDAYRLVRSTLMVNPLPIVIPCHRVVPRKGGTGSYIGGTKKKKWLVNLERRSLAALEVD